MKSVGLVGLPQAGTSTVFTALTAIQAGPASRTHQAVVPVPDPRIDELGRLHSSKKLVYAQLRFLETTGLVRRGARGQGSLAAELIGHLREADALVLVIRAFGEDADPVADLSDLSLELTLADLAVFEAKVLRGSKAARAGDAGAVQELAAVEKAKAVLESGTPLREAAWEAAEIKALAALSPLTLKPVVLVATVDPERHVDIPPGATPVASLLESEVAGMVPDEAAELLSSYGLSERALTSVIRAVFDRLDLITFLTAGEKEARGWEIPAGATAPEAAGAIHSDIQRGFIRAEVISYDALLAVGGWPQARAQGIARQEGKDYVMREGDVVEFRFAV